VLSLLDGQAATYPLPPFVLTDATLTAVARLLRGYHQAASTFVIPDGAVWQWPAHEPQELACHNDIAPYNLVFDREEVGEVGQLVGAPASVPKRLPRPDRWRGRRRPAVHVPLVALVRRALTGATSFRLRSRVALTLRPAS
jgi:hypothetical protein